VAVLKLDGQGNLVWQKAISDGAQGRVYLDVAADGSAVVVSDYFFEAEDGALSWGMLLNVLSPDGRLLWQRLVAPNSQQYSLVPREVRVGPDGGVYVLAMGWSHNGPDWTSKAHLFKFGDCGNLAWQRRYGLPAIPAEAREAQENERMTSLYAADLEFDSDGGILIAGGIRMDTWDTEMGAGSNTVGMFLLKAGPDGRLQDGCPFRDDVELPVEVVEYLPADVEMQIFDGGLPIREGRLESEAGPFFVPDQLCGMSLPAAGE
jgi:hypothetical protein